MYTRRIVACMYTEEAGPNTENYWLVRVRMDDEVEAITAEAERRAEIADLEYLFSL